MSQGSTRRDFLKQSAAAGVGFWVAGGLALADSKSPLERVNIACIGVGGKGSSDTDQAANHGNIVALCDIDDYHLWKKSEALDEKFPLHERFHDYRKMFDQMGKNIDAVVVSTPDHTHAPASLMAMRLGKHVYCQKPLTHTVHEARLMRETAAKQRVVTQMGNQGSAENGLRRAVEIIQDGVIGTVREVHVWTNRPIWPQAPKIVARPKKKSPVPPYVHWDLFLGSAPYRPYVGNRVYHDFAWRGWWDFGTGALGDMACHTANMAYRALKLGLPTSIQGECGDLNPETYPSWARVEFEFPERDGMPPVKLVWYEGKRDGKRVVPPDELVMKLPVPEQRQGERGKGKGKDKDKDKDKEPKDPKQADRERRLGESGSMLLGEKGILFSPNDYGASYKLLPEADYKDYKGPKETLPRNGKGDDGMKAEWVAGIKGGPTPYSNFDIAGMLTETILLGNVAMRCPGKKLEYDGPNLRITNVSEANQYLRKEYRKGFEV
jgi:predicted dehydrogenase